MSVSKWAYTPEVCDGGGCPGDCDLCDKPKNMEDEDDVTDYIKRSDAIRAMAQYMMDTALIDNPEASDRIEQWEGNIAAPVMSTVEAADVIEADKAQKEVDYWHDLAQSYEQTITKLTLCQTDVVEVVRCKDCKHGRDTVRGNYKHKLNLIDCNLIDDEHPYIMRSNDFCSWGEVAEK